MNFSFAGCGFLGIYHVGVASCLRQHAPQLVENGIFAGASAGAIVSCCLLCGCCLGECTSFILRLATKARSKSLGPLHPSFNIVKILRDALNVVLPENAHTIASGKLFISLTRVSDRKAVLVSQYDSKEELIQALLCSAHIPFYSGLLPPVFKGTRYVDGGLSDNLPVLDENTVTVSPFAGESDICPSDEVANDAHIHLANTSVQLSGKNLYRITRILFPCKPELLSDMCKHGFDDCLRFLQRNELITCSRHLTVKSSIVSVEESSSSLSLVPSRQESSNLNEEEVDGLCDEENCEDCRIKQKGALVDTLPPIVVEAFQAAISTSFQSYIHRSRTLRCLGVLATPWVLPFDIVYNGVVRLLEYLPSLPQDMTYMYREIIDLMTEITARLSNKKRRYTARFTCQLAITEFNLNKDVSRRALPSSSPYQPQPTAPVVRNLNIGFAVDFDTKVRNSLHTLRHLEGHMDHMNIDKISLESSSHGQNVVVSTDMSNMKESTLHNQEIFDTFEQCLHISNEMESVMAYYYKDEEDTQRYNFEEIFDIDKMDMNLPSPSKDIHSPDLSWDSYMEMKPEIEQETEDFINELLNIPETNHHQNDKNLEGHCFRSRSSSLVSGCSAGRSRSNSLQSGCSAGGSRSNSKSNLVL
ncbi:patatin-like phospholipase domain-containing protein 2 [Mytilus galloprovincialis]|uniref:patatin-like phospholipase domain-containing protein 2 n=1 Tax=Mytilus galloprovincialis TaxID=29158 RepID=UPI003F7C48C6